MIWSVYRWVAGLNLLYTDWIEKSLRLLKIGLWYSIWIDMNRLITVPKNVYRLSVYKQNNTGIKAKIETLKGWLIIKNCIKIWPCILWNFWTNSHQKRLNLYTLVNIWNVATVKTENVIFQYWYRLLLYT